MADPSSPANHRIRSYKNKALDSQEMRRRREEEGIQLRKQKREEQVRHFLFLSDVATVLYLLSSLYCSSEDDHYPA